jgi:hypothetical protein
MMRIAPALLLSLVAACGDVTAPGGGGGSDGGPDGGPRADAPGPGSVAVTVLDPDGTRAPLEGVPVLFLEADGAEADTVLTGDDGVATAELRAGGAVIAFVTSAFPAGVSTPLTWAVLDVHPGDAITLGDRLTNSTPTETMTIELPVMEGASYQVYTPCGSFGEGDNVVQIGIRANCSFTDFSIAAYATVGEDVYAVTDTGLTFDADSNHVVADPWALVPAPDVTFEGLDDVSIVFARWQRAILGGVNLPLAGYTDDGEVDGDVLTLAPRRLDAPEHVMLEVGMAAEQPGLGGQSLAVWSDGDEEEDLLVDAEELLLPWIGPPAIDQAARSVSWPHVGEGAWDATYFSFRWTATDGEVTSAGQWRVVAPPGRHELALPPLPEAYRDWLPAEIDTIDAAYVILFDSDALDWDGARQLGLDPPSLFDYAGTLTEPATLRNSSSFFD